MTFSYSKMTTNATFQALLEADDVCLGTWIRTPYPEHPKHHLCHEEVDFEMDITRLVTDTTSEFKV